ncbi:MAG: YqaE/Pmp3 family membrane protein [Saprospiraceae bacterium]
MRTIRLVLFAVLFAAIGLPQAKAVLVTPVNPAQQEADALAAAQEYQASLKAMSAKERRELRREQRHSMRNALKDFKKGDQSRDGANTVLLVILAIFIPPLAVFLHQGEINGKFWISLLLTLLFVLPGVIYSLIVVLGAA